MTVWRPLVVSVSSSELVVAEVASVTDAMSSVPLLITSTARSIVSPGASPVAPTERRFAEPLAPSATTTVPDATVWLADVELVNVANVPRPAIDAAAPSVAVVSRTLLVSDRERLRPTDAVCFMFHLSTGGTRSVRVSFSARRRHAGRPADDED